MRCTHDRLDIIAIDPKITPKLKYCVKGTNEKIKQHEPTTFYNAHKMFFFSFKRINDEPKRRRWWWSKSKKNWIKKKSEFVYRPWPINRFSISYANYLVGCWREQKKKKRQERKKNNEKNLLFFDLFHSSHWIDSYLFASNALSFFLWAKQISPIEVGWTRWNNLLSDWNYTLQSVGHIENHFACNSEYVYIYTIFCCCFIFSFFLYFFFLTANSTEHIRTSYDR